MKLAAILRTIARVHRYMSGNETYDHGVMLTTKGELRTDNRSVTASKLMARLLSNAPESSKKAPPARLGDKKAP